MSGNADIIEIKGTKQLILNVCIRINHFGRKTVSWIAGYWIFFISSTFQVRNAKYLKSIRFFLNYFELPNTSQCCFTDLCPIVQSMLIILIIWIFLILLLIAPDAWVWNFKSYSRNIHDWSTPVYIWLQKCIIFWKRFFFHKTAYFCI